MCVTDLTLVPAGRRSGRSAGGSTRRHTPDTRPPFGTPSAPSPSGWTERLQTKHVSTCLGERTCASGGVCARYRSSTRLSCRNSVSGRRTTESGERTGGCYRTARCLCMPLHESMDSQRWRPGRQQEAEQMHSQQLVSSTSRGQSAKPSQIMLDLMHTLLPGHSHRARSEQPAGHMHVTSVRVHVDVMSQMLTGLTAVVLVAVVVTVQVSVAALAGQDAAARPTLEVTGGALCYHGNTTRNQNDLRGNGGSIAVPTKSVPSTPGSGRRQVTFPPSSGN